MRFSPPPPHSSAGVTTVPALTVPAFTAPVFAVLVTALLALLPGMIPVTSADTTPVTPASSPQDNGAAVDEASPDTEYPPNTAYQDATAASGLAFIHFNGATGEWHFPEISGGAGALLDYDGDGDLDLFLVQSSILAREASLDDALFPPLPGVPLSDRLFRNDLETPGGTPRFTEVTVDAGFADEAEHGQGVAVGDYDGDGFPDLYVTNAGPNRLWRNQGDGTFRDVTAEAGAGDARWSVPATFFDADGDGDLDLFVGNYVDYVPTRNVPCTGNSGRRDYCGPASYSGEPDRLLENRGDGTFRDATAEAGLRAAYGPALGVVAGDFDGDGHADLYVANDGEANQLWMGQGDGTFRDQALLRGVALNAAGRAEASMGIAVGDPDEDGDEDLFVTHLRNETHTLYLNQGGGLFRDATAAARLAGPSLPRTGFGAVWTDFDLDGDLDLAVTHGAVLALEELRRQEDPFPFAEPGHLYVQETRGTERQRTPKDGDPPRFREAAAELALPLAVPTVGRALLAGDLDNDGDEDLVVVANSGPTRLLLNTTLEGTPSRRTGPSWIGVHAVLPPAAAGAPHREAIGSRLAITVGEGEPRWRRVRTDGSYAAAHDPRVRLALPEASPEPTTVSVRIEWPDGSVDAWTGLLPNRYHRLMAGAGTVDSAAVSTAESAATQPTAERADGPTDGHTDNLIDGPTDEPRDSPTGHQAGDQSGDRTATPKPPSEEIP